MKQFIMTAVISSASILAMAQTSTVTHIVQRGETIESIAEYYHVSVDDINKANPNTEGLVYVGMKLMVPVKEYTQQKGTDEQIHNTKSVSNVAKSSEEHLSLDNQQGKHFVNPNSKSSWEMAVEVGLGFIKGSSNFAYEATLGANYHFPFNLYVGGRIGYNSCNYNYSTGATTIKSTCHFIEIPLELGYVLATGDEEWGIIPFAGFGANIGLTGKSKFETYGSSRDEQEEKNKIGGQIGLDARLGLHMRLYGFNVTGSYHIPLNDKQKGWFGKDSYPEISIDFGF